jgi:hypothetical protein
VGLQPDIILTGGNLQTVAVQRETRTIPIVFASLVDPVADGIVSRLDRPTENVTGFGGLEATLGGKWLELLSEIACSRSCQSLRPFIATLKSKRTGLPSQVTGYNPMRRPRRD